MISLLSTNSILLLSLWYNPITPFHYYPSGKAPFLSVKRQYWSRTRKTEERLPFASHHPFSSLTCTLPFTPFVTKSSLAFERAPAAAAVCVQQTARWKTPSFAGGPVQAKHWAGRGLFPLLVPHRLHSRDTLSLQTPPPLRPTGSGVGNRPQKAQLETLRGEVRTLPPGRWRPGSCSSSSPCARSPRAHQVPVPEFPGPRRDAAAGRRERGGGRGAPRPTQAGEGGSSSPHTASAAPGPSGTHPGLPEPWGPAVPPPPPRAARSARGETMGTMTSPSSNASSSGGRRRLPPGPQVALGPSPPLLGLPPRGVSGSEVPLHPSPAATLRAAAAGGGPSRGTPPPPGPSAPPAPPRTHPRYL